MRRSKITGSLSAGLMCATASQKTFSSISRWSVLNKIKNRPNALLFPTQTKYWEIIADKLSSACWTWGYCSAVTRQGRRWIVDAYQSDGKRYIVESDELLSAFLELEATLL